jgi:hypothetical protein
MCNQKSLLRIKTKNEMVPTFVSGVFLSGAINILTNDSARSDVSEMLSMIIMFLSSLFFFFYAAKIHELQTWFETLADENKTDECFLNDTMAWDLRGYKDFFKPIMIVLPFLSWGTGIISLLVYLWGDDIWKGLCSLPSFVAGIFH